MSRSSRRTGCTSTPRRRSCGRVSRAPGEPRRRRPATAQPATALRAVGAISWSAHEVDLSRDGADWAALEERERELLYWVLSSLMVAEERISTQFCGLVLAQEDEEEGS